MSKRIYPLLIIIILCHPVFVYAYIGPGAGFALIGSALTFILAALMGLVTLIFWPLQQLWRYSRRKRRKASARTERLVILGLDGLDPSLIDRYMDQGLLPNFQALAREGGYRRLRTTLPAISPVAWSTFQTGVNPGGHTIFDFLTRDKRTYLPDLSSTRILPTSNSFFGKIFQNPWRRSPIVLLRKSKTFWKILGEHGIFSSILRIPISYPPEKFNGHILAAMCTPDLLGTQGSFCVYTSHQGEHPVTGGRFKSVQWKENTIKSRIEGPPNPFNTHPSLLKCPFTIRQDSDSARLTIGKTTIRLQRGELSPWIRIPFRACFGKTIYGIARFCIREFQPYFMMYVSPINIDPEYPCLPIASPLYYASYLAKENGLYGTLGLMEDTWGRNEQVLDDDLFLKQTYLTHQERETMFFSALDKTRKGVTACVFDAGDRIQHMFWRYLDPNHPAPRESRAESSATIPEIYQVMDQLVGKTRSRLNPQDTLIVISDHGFTSFRRCVNLNTWLEREGYLVRNGNPDADYLQSIDWKKTKAFALGLSGIYLNRKDREYQGIVSAHECESLKQEIISRLNKLIDPADGNPAVRQVYNTAREYRGIYVQEAPDLMVGFNSGYRVSWESVTGKITPEIFQDNLKAWSGDHCVDPELVPGILFSNLKITVTDPHIIDIAPTVLELFSIPRPSYMEGRSIL